MMMKIDRFGGEYSFLSNFYPCEITVDGITYPTVEHAFQAQKTTIREEKQKIANAPTPGAAKKLGRRVTLRSNWEEVKVDVMRGLLLTKFVDDEVLGRKLKATGDAELIEGNWWHDRFWGVCNGTGRNQLGKLLMEIREAL